MRKWVFLVAKDLLAEWRLPRVWPAMVLVGLVLAATLTLPLELLPDEKRLLGPALLWVATLLAAMLAVERSFASEQQEGAWEGLRMYPLRMETVYLAKMGSNVLAVACLQALLVPLFSVLTGLPLATHPLALLAVVVLGNLAITSLGTLLSALAMGLRHLPGTVALLVLPAGVPVVLAAAEGTRLLAEPALTPPFWRWVQYLGVFAAVFIAAGIVLVDIAVEE